MTAHDWAVKERSNAGRHRRDHRLVPGRLSQFVAESLVRNSAFMIANIVLTAICGFGALSLLTRLYSVEAVGVSAAALSAGGLIGFITQFGINYSLPRFLPTSTHRAALINTVLTVTMLATFVGAGVFLVLPVADKMYVLGGNLFIFAFLIGTTLDAGETNLEVVFVADRQVSRIVRANVIANLVKLAAPVAFVFLGMFGAYLSRVIYGAAEFFALAVMLGRQGHRFRPTFSKAATRDMRGFSAASYLGSLFGTLPMWVLPILILSRFGPSESAYWYTAMAIAALLSQIPGSVARVLLVEVAHRPSERRDLVRNAARVVTVITVPVFAVAYLAAPFVLALFGPHYVSGSLAALRWLIAAGLIAAVNYVTGPIILLAKKPSVLAFINAVNVVIVLGLSATWARNVRDVAICWFIGQIPSTVLYTLFAIRSLRQVRGRWEELGGDRPDRPPPAAGLRASARDKQLAGLEALLSLASLQGVEPAYGSDRWLAQAPAPPGNGGDQERRGR